MTDAPHPAPPGDDDLVRRLDARLEAAEAAIDAPPDPGVEVVRSTPPPIEPIDETTGAVLQELAAVLRSLDHRLCALETIAADSRPAEPAPAVLPEELAGRLDQLQAQMAQLAKVAAPPSSAEPGDQLDDQLELLRNQLEHAFYEVDVRFAALDQQVRTLAQGVSQCVEDLSDLRHQVPGNPADAGELMPSIERLEKSLHELNEKADDLSLRTSLDYERLDEAVRGLTPPAVATQVERTVNQSSLELAADIATLRNEVGAITRAVAAQGDTVKLLNEHISWIRQRLLR